MTARQLCCRKRSAFTYLFPASVIPKPADWGPHIDLANFIFFDQADAYTPPPDLLEFLAAGERPIYVGFGSCIVKNPIETSPTIFAALEGAGVRGIVSRGWGHLGGNAPPPNVYLIDDCPHDWLFPRCRAVCHHGGAGTTSAGLRAGLPTVVVPFFGDQYFRGQVVVDAGAGPKPIPIDTLNVDRLAEAFAACARAEMRTCAEELGAKIRTSDGVELVFESLRRHLPIAAMRCARDPEHLATMYCEPCRLRLCAPCYDRQHRDHVAHRYRYVDWGEREPQHLTNELPKLIDDAASALRTARDELKPVAAPRRDGVVIGDTHARGRTFRRVSPKMNLRPSRARPTRGVVNRIVHRFTPCLGISRHYASHAVWESGRRSCRLCAARVMSAGC